VLLDRRILEAIREAALHLVHNAVDHGIETADLRVAAGKPAKGRIHFAAETDGDRVQLVVWDDGQGIDPDAVVRVAVERGFVNPGAAAHLTPAEAYQLLELPGFTTRGLATDVSGRGIGLDAVAASFRAIGGDLWIRSTKGQGTRVTVELPVTRRGERVLVVQVGTLVLALPSSAVKSFNRLRPGMLVIEDGRSVVRYGEETLAAVAVPPLFGEAMHEHSTLVETTIGGSTIGVIVDEIIGDEEVFVRPIPAIAGAPSVVEGIALLASGLPVAVLSLQRLGPLGLGEIAAPRTGGARRRISILLVDDTAATREMVRRLLEDEGFVVTSVDTAEKGLERIESEPFDCVITGVELPGLSGIEMTRRIRSSDLFSDLPVVVVSTLDRPAQRLEGLEAGADAYLTKQGMDPGHLVAVIRRVTAA
jgi:CheY-like chemotaxis protein